MFVKKIHKVQPKEQCVSGVTTRLVTLTKLSTISEVNHASGKFGPSFIRGWETRIANMTVNMGHTVAFVVSQNAQCSDVVTKQLGYAKQQSKLS